MAETDKTARFSPALELSSPVAESLEAWAVESYPYETCGLILGRFNDESVEAIWPTLAKNLDRHRPRDRYVLDPADFLVADRQARAFGLEVVGIWHTHPDHPAIPSHSDLESAWEGYSYLILSTAKSEVVDLRSWRLREQMFNEQPITMEESSS